MIKIKNLSFSYGKKDALKNISFRIPKGTLCGLMGPNGSGKSTLFKCCLNFLKNYKGAIEIDGKNAAGLKPSAAAKLVSYVPQEHKPSFPFTVYEIVLMGRTPHMGGIFGPSKEDKKIAEKAMDKVGIADLAPIPCSMLSGGQRQLALIARAIAQEAPLMLLDEPTSALDFSNQIKIWEIMKKIASEGVSIIACSHDPNHILWFADTAVALHNGEVVADGKAEEVLNENLLTQIYGCAYELKDLGAKKIICPKNI